MVYNDTSMRKPAKNPQTNKTVFLKDRVNVNVNEVLTWNSRMRKTQRKTTQREKEMTGIVTKYLKRRVAWDVFYHSFLDSDIGCRVFFFRFDSFLYSTIQQSNLKALCVLAVRQERIIDLHAKWISLLSISETFLIQIGWDGVIKKHLIQQYL
jgi:hypothetical protein